MLLQWLSASLETWFRFVSLMLALKAIPPHQTYTPVLPVSKPHIAHVVQLYEVSIERLIERDAARHVLAQALQAPRSALVQLIHDTLEVIVGKLKQ
jgi:hypothetical protein